MAATAIMEVTDSNFEQEVLKSSQPVMIDFWAQWCSPCKALAPVVDEVAMAYNGKLKVVKMDVDKNASIPPRYGVRGIPTLLFIKDGVVRDTLVGNVPKEAIEKKISQLV